MMNIYQAELKDIKGITPLFNKYREFYRQAPDQDGAETFLKTRLKNGESVIFTASENGEYLGFAQLYPVFSSVAMKRTYILNDLFVAEHARKKGAGQKLLAAAKEFAAQNGAKSLSLQTAPDNHAARSLYEQNGYEEDKDFIHYICKVQTT